MSRLLDGLVLWDVWGQIFLRKHKLLNEALISRL